MTSKKGNFEQTTCEKYEGRFKSYVFLLMHELLQSQLSTTLFYQLLLLIEAIQLIWYSVHPNLSFLRTTEAITYIRYAIQYFQFDYLLTKGNSAFFTTILFVVFGIQVFVILAKLLITCQLVRNKKKTSTFTTYSVKFLSLYAVLLQTVLTIPFAEVFYTSFYCTSDDPVHGGMSCYSGIYFLYLIIGIIGFILFITLIVLYSLLYADINPNSTIPFASPQSRVGLLKLLLKLALPLYFVLDYNAGYTKYYIAIVGIVWLGLLGFRLRAPPYYDDSVFTVLIGFEAVLFWFAAVANIQAFLNLDTTFYNIGLFFAVLFAPFFAYVYYKIIERLKWRIIRMDIKNMKDYDVEIFVNMLLKLIEQREKPEKRIILEGIIKQYLKNSQKREEEGTAMLLAEDMLREEETPEKARSWYKLVLGILLEAFDKNSKSNRLHMLYAYVLQEKLKNKYKALSELMKVKEHKPNLIEDFSIYRYKNLIEEEMEEEMIESDIRNSESKDMDVNIIAHFQNRFVEFQSAIEKSVLFHLDFWRELKKDNPDIQKLQGLGSKITSNVEVTSDMFKKLNEMNPNNIRCLQIYGNFLKDIVNDDTEGQRILEKAEKQKQKETTGHDVEENNAHSNHDKSVEDGAQAERSSNHPAGSSVNDDMRALKDTKIAISEKNEPRSIKILKRTMIVAMLIVIALAASSFGVRSLHKSDISGGISAITAAYQRTTILADILFYTRRLQLLAIGSLFDTTPASLEGVIKDELLTLINNLQTCQFNVITADIGVGADSNTNTNYTIFNLLEDGSNSTFEAIYDHALFQFITSAASVWNSSLSGFTSTSSVDSTWKNFFYVNYNGLGPLRWGSENIAMDFYIYYYDRTSTYQMTIEAFFITALIVILISQCIIVPFVFTVQKTNNRVLSLFGYIPDADLEFLADKCKRYLDIYLEDRDDKRYFSFDGSQDEEEEEEKCEVVEHMSNSQMANSRVDRQRMKSSKMNRSKDKSRNSKLKIEGSKIELSKMEGSKSDVETNANLKRSEKLLNSTDNNRVKIIIQFTVFALLYMAYFAIDFGTEVPYVGNVQRAYLHLRQILERPADLKFVNVFLQEEIALMAPLSITGNDTLVWYANKVYAIEQDITNSDSGFPSQFNDYNLLFQEINLNNTCSYITTDANCETIGGGILERGLTQAVLNIVEENRDLDNQFFLVNPLNTSVVRTYLNSTSFLTSMDMITYTDAGMKAIITSFTNGFSSYLNYAWDTEIIKFSIFLVFQLFVFVIIWTPYLKNLSQNIWRTKSMLNMISMEVMSKNESLKKVFTSNNLLQAIR